MSDRDNITLPREVVELALEALEWSWGGEPMGTKELAAITALRTALAAEQPKPEPVAWLSRDEARLALWKAINSREFGNPTDDKLILDHLRQQGLWIGKVTSPALAAEQPKPEPVAWMRKEWSPDCGSYFDFCAEEEMGWRDRKEWTPLYATPPATHPGYIIGSHWLETAYSRVCAGEAEADVLRDCGWKRVDDAEALRRDAERYRYLRSRDPKEVFNKSGKAAGVWIDWEDDLSGLQLLTGDDADAAIDAAMENKP